MAASIALESKPTDNTIRSVRTINIVGRSLANAVRAITNGTGSIKATGNRATVNRWLPMIRENKAEIIELLQGGDTDKSAASLQWLFHFADRNDFPVTFVPAVNHETAPGYYPTAIAAEPAPIRPQRKPTKAEADEITALVQAIYASDTDADRAEALATALTDPDGALLCYREIAKERRSP